MRVHFIGYYELDENLEERRHTYNGLTHPDDCARMDMEMGKQSPELLFECCEEVTVLSVGPVREDTIYERARDLLGKQVNVLLGFGTRLLFDDDDGSGFPNEEFDCNRPVIARGKLLGFGADGTFELLQDDGMVHWCWPMLEIEEFPEGQSDRG